METNDILIGREKECRLIGRLMDGRKNIFIFGKEGVGKSAIINAALNKSKSKKIFYSRNSSTLRESLISLFSSAYGEDKNTERGNTLTLRKSLYKFLNDMKPEYLIFDHMVTPGPRFHSFIEYLIEKEIRLIILARGSGDQDIGHHLWASLFNFVKVEISNFDKAKADDLIDHYIEQYGINIASKEGFRDEIFHYSQGNPKIIKELCLLSCDQQYYVKGFLDTRLIDLDRRIKEVVHSSYV